MNRKSVTLAKAIKNIFSPVRTKKRASIAKLNVETLDSRIVPATFAANSAAADGAVGSLRDAINQANADTDAVSTITLTGATPFTITLAGATQENNNAKGDFDLDPTGKGGHTFIFQGAGAATTVIDGAGLDRVFQIFGKNIVKFQNVTIQNGKAQDDGTAGVAPGTTVSKGGAILNSGGADIFFTGAVVKANTAFGAPGIQGGDGKSLTGGAASNGKAGSDGTNGLSAFGGGIYSTGGTVTIGAASEFSTNKAIGGDGANGGKGFAAGNKAAAVGGAGGKGGNSGDGFGGAVFAEAGNVVVNGGATVKTNSAQAGIAGDGGLGGKGGTKAGQFGGAGGAGGNGGSAGGGGIHSVAGNVTVTGGFITTNHVNNNGGGGNGDGGDGGLATGAGGAGVGGAGGVGGTGGKASGGGISVVTGNIVVDGGTTVQSNDVNKMAYDGAGGKGGKGGNALVANGVGGSAGKAGISGDGLGGGLYAVTGNISVTGGAKVLTNKVKGGTGGEGQIGGDGKNAGFGGAAAAAGNAAGGGVYVGTGKVDISGGAQVSGNTVNGGAAKAGGQGGAAGATAKGVGGNAGAGASSGKAQGAGVYAGTGDITISGAAALAGNIATGGAAVQGAAGGAATGNMARAGNGGSGSAAGLAQGGAVYAGAGTVTVNGASAFTGNQALAGAAGAGGDGGAAGGTKATGGNGGNAGAAASAKGGGVYNAKGDIIIDAGSKLSGGNKAKGGDGGKGGAGKDGKGVGGNAGLSTSGGAGAGGAIAAEAGNVTISAASQITGSLATGGAGADGNVGGKGSGAAASGIRAGNGSSGGNGGVAHGGAIWASNGTVTVNASQIQGNNVAKGGDGGVGGNGGLGVAGAGKDGAGGNGGAGGEGQGGGIWAKDGSVVVSGSAAVNQNTAAGGAGKKGGDRGNAANGTAANGNGGDGGVGQGGGIFTVAASVTVSGRSNINTNKANGNNAGNGATGAANGGGAQGTGGKGGGGAGGAIFSNSGDISVTLSSIGQNQVNAGNGGNGGAKGTGIGAGGVGGSATGGGVAVTSGKVTLDQANFNGNLANKGGNGGTDAISGGNGGDSLGGGLFVPATSGGVTVTNSSFFLNRAQGAGTATSAPGVDGSSLGGGIYSTAPITSITNSTIALNKASGSNVLSAGGGVYVNSTGAAISNSTIVYNAATTAGGGVRNDGKLDITSTIIGRNNTVATPSLTNLGGNQVQNGSSPDVSNIGTTTGKNNLVESSLGGVTLSDPSNTVGTTFLNPAFHQTPVSLLNNNPSQNTVFVDSQTLTAPQIGSNGTQYFRLVTSSEFGVATGGDSLTKLPVGALSAVDKGSNPLNLTVDQIQNPRVQGLAADIGAIEGNASVVDSQGAFVVSVVFSTKIAPGTATYDTATVTFSEAIDPTSFGVAQVLSLTAPDGSAIIPTSVTPVGGSGNKVFDISFPNSDKLGKYTLLLSQTIRDTAAGTQNQMDDNKNGINGEAAPNPIGTAGPGDQDLSTSVLVNPAITSGAAVTNAVFSGTGSTINKVRLTFDQAIDASTFTPADVTITPNLIGAPAIFVTGVTPVAGTSDQFDITFTPASAGPVTLTLGVDILNFGGTAGLQMNQNGNAINGEAGIAPAGDQYQVSSAGAAAGIAFAVGGADGHVRILDKAGVVISDLTPITGYTGLVSVALGDFNNDSINDVYVAAAANDTQSGLTTANAGKVFVYDGAAFAKGTLTSLTTITPFSASSTDPAVAYTNGLNIATGDVDGDGKVDLVAGTRGIAGGVGLTESGRLIVVGNNGTAIAPAVTPFSAGYQKGVVVAAGDLNGDGKDEIAVTRGGPVASTNPAVQSIKLKAYQLTAGALAELDLAGNAFASPLAPFGTSITRDARVTFTDGDGDGKDELVFSALDPSTSTPTTTHNVRIAAFTVDLVTGAATAVSTGTGPSNSYLIGNSDIADHAITSVAGTGAVRNLALATQNATASLSGVQFLNPLTGAVITGGFTLPITTGGVTIDGI